MPQLLSAEAAIARSAAILRGFALSRKVGMIGADSKRLALSGTLVEVMDYTFVIGRNTER